MANRVVGNPPVIDAAPSGPAAGSDRVRMVRSATESGPVSQPGQVRLASVDMVAAAAVIGSIDALIDQETIVPELDLSPSPNDTAATDLTEAALKQLMSVTIAPGPQDGQLPPGDLDIFELDLEQLMALEVFGSDALPEDLTLISFEDLLEVDVEPGPAEPPPAPYDLTRVDLETLQDLQFGDQDDAADDPIREFASLDPGSVLDDSIVNNAAPVVQIAELSRGSGSIYTGPQPTPPEPVLHDGDDPASPPAPPNAPPSAAGEFLSIPAGQALSGNVLANDTDPDGDPLIVLGAGSFSSVMAGSVEIAVDGEFTYQAADGYSGTDSFGYIVSDDHGNTAPAAVSIDVTPADPVAVDDDVKTDEDVAITFDAAANDIDPLGDALVIEEVTQGANGSVDINIDGKLTYTPNPNFFGTDSFTYTAYDATGAAATATARIVVAPVNDAPVAVDDAIAATEGIATRGNLLDNDLDPDGDTLTVTTTGILTTTAGGRVQIADDGTFNYAATTGFLGTDTFTYSVSDGSGGSATATATVTVVAANQDPVAVDDSFAIVRDTTITGSVLGNDSDPDGDAIVVGSAGDFDSARGGRVALNTDGSFEYKPLAGFVGADSFTYTIEDGQGGSATATVAINIFATGGDLNGTVGDDWLIGTPGVDFLDAKDGDDMLIGLADADTLNGGAGIDTASYAGSGSAVEVSLESRTGQGGDAEGDTLVQIENLIGSAFDDVIIGDQYANRLEGGEGNDRIEGGQDVDALYGGGDDDILSGGQGQDTLFGGQGNDMLNGDQGADILEGGSGNDTLNGNQGADILEGGLGDDTLTGGQGGDTFVVGPGSGTDTDTILDFGSGPDVIDLSAFGIAGFSGIDIAADGSGGSVITLPGGDSVVITGLDTSLLTPSDIIL